MTRDPGKRRASIRRWYERHKSAISAKRKAYYEANRDVCIARTKKWQKSNPKKTRYIKRSARIMQREYDARCWQAKAKEKAEMKKMDPEKLEACKKMAREAAVAKAVAKALSVVADRKNGERCGYSGQLKPNFI